MPATNVSRPRWDRARARWVVRWDEDGKRRARGTWTREQLDEANAFRAELLGAAEPSQSPDEARASAAGSVAALLATYDGSPGWWDGAHGWLACELLRAVQARDSARLDEITKAVRAFSPLANSQANQRDVKELEAAFRRLKVRYTELSEGARHGARVDAPAPDGSSGGAVVRRGEPVH